MTDHDPPLPDTTADAMTVVRRDLSDAHADLHQVQSVTLREGPRSKKTARYVAVKNRHTGEVHHHALTLETGKKLKGTWELDDKRSISFSDEDGDEIGRLIDFLRQMRGDVAAPPASSPAIPSTTPSTAPAVPTELPAWLKGLSTDAEALKGLVRAVRDQPEVFRGTAAAITFGRYAQALERLKKILAADEDDVAALRALIAAHAWLVASEYGEPLPAEELGEEALLRRSPSGRLELILIGRPRPVAGLFEEEAPSAALARALGDAMRLRDLVAPAGEVTVTLLIGNTADDEQASLLRRLNAHLSGIEVLSYDQVLERAQRVLDVLRATAKRE